MRGIGQENPPDIDARAFVEQRPLQSNQSVIAEQKLRTDSLSREAVTLGVSYLLLVTLFFTLSTFISTPTTGKSIPAGSIEHLAWVEILFGLTSFFIMSMAVWYLRRKKMMHNILLCFLISALVAIADFLLTQAFYKTLYGTEDLNASLMDNIMELFMCWAMFFGWSSIFLTLLYSFDVRERERQLAAVREQAISAQMRALRYQINPHFLFNTLNSISGLIEEGAATRAEKMVLSLSTFMRTTLSLDPMQDVSLADEIALQEEYLEIERERFADRLTFNVEVEKSACDAIVPSLILQPLIENAIKHGVGATAGPVEILLIAQQKGERLIITVENDMPNQTDIGVRPPGLGVGLQNVEERLRARFDQDVLFSAGYVSPTRYRVVFNVPCKHK